MVEIITAKTAGFCFGVKNAVDRAFALADECEELYTFGPVIHNSEVISRLEEKGARILNSEEELAALTSGTILLRSHGVTRHVMEILKEKGLSYVDATCPFVNRIHEVVDRESVEKQIVIAGNPSHPEVLGIMGWCRTPATVLSTEEEAESFEPDERKNVCVVAQTTFNLMKFEKIVEIFKKKSYYVSIVNTICNATARHQEEARSIAESVDAMIVIGDRKSSNSRKLYEICREVCEKTDFVQTAADLTLKQDGSIHAVGITAGASTPNYIIEEVQKHVGREF
ncbi:MAG: 4-hydroxy-3-methylbut-2-enyl diphosphate reductase [Lachnospiraceae bacterium]|nr:4-hydroxy-3-methylbut-2-enyl diphosphate reductase [Lachnospiraceae bacterium]